MGKKGDLFTKVTSPGLSLWSGSPFFRCYHWRKGWGTLFSLFVRNITKLPKAKDNTVEYFFSRISCFIVKQDKSKMNVLLIFQQWMLTIHSEYNWCLIVNIFYKVGINILFWRTICCDSLILKSAVAALITIKPVYVCLYVLYTRVCVCMSVSHWFARQLLDLSVHIYSAYRQLLS